LCGKSPAFLAGLFRLYRVPDLQWMPADLKDYTLLSESDNGREMVTCPIHTPISSGDVRFR
jgi:hypothetical protein